MNPLPLEELSLRKAQTLNGIIGKRRRARFSLDGNVCEFRFTMPRTDMKLHQFFKIKLSDYYVWVGMERMPDPGFFAKEFDGLKLDRLPEEVRPVIFEGAMSKLLGQLEATMGVVLSMESYGDEWPSDLPEEKICFVVKSEQDGQRYRGVLHVDRAGLEFLGALIERTRPILSKRFNELRVPTRLIIGQQMLGYREYKNIGVNDILLFKGYDFLNKGDCVARFGRRYSFKAIFQEGKVTLGSIMDEEMADNENMPKEPTEEVGDETMAPVNELEGMEEEEEEMAPEEPESAETPEEVVTEVAEETEPMEDLEPMEEEDVHPLGQLPIKIVFEVGRRTLPLDELKSLQEGYVFELMNPADKPVTIRANGQVVGTGELLQIGDRVGVRVSKFHKR